VNPVQLIGLDAVAKRPLVFTFHDLEPDTRYRVLFHGVCKYHAHRRMASFKTKAVWPTSFRLMALSCDRPSRLLLGQEDPWQHMLKRMEGVDVVLHIGDQVYPDDEDISDADRIFNEIFDDLEADKQRSMRLRGRELWRNKYRKVRP